MVGASNPTFASLLAKTVDEATRRDREQTADKVVVEQDPRRDGRTSLAAGWPDTTDATHLVATIDYPSRATFDDLANLGIAYEWLAGPNRKPLAATRVVVTRSLVSSTELALSLADRGAHVLTAPCLATAPSSTPDRAARALDELGQRHGLILSSPIAAQTFFARWDAATVRALPGRLAVVGPSTARACRELGHEPDIVATDPRSEGVVACLEATHELSRRWLHWRADTGRDVLVRAFERAGGSLDIVEGYRSVRPDWPAALRRVLLSAWPVVHSEVVIVTSGKAAEHLLTNLGQDVVAERWRHRARFVALGPTTDTAMRELGLTVAAVATTPSTAGLIAAVTTATS